MSDDRASKALDFFKQIIFLLLFFWLAGSPRRNMINSVNELGHIFSRFRVIDAFERKIELTIEDNISKKIEDGVAKLDSSLQSLPQEIAIADVAVLNVTFVDSPVLSSSSIKFKINGLLSPFNQVGAENSVDGESRHSNVRNSVSHVPFQVSSCA